MTYRRIYPAKPKLPRKRKKAAIKTQGRKWYHNTIQLWKVGYEDYPTLEPVCKFWVNNSVIERVITTKNGGMFMLMEPTKFW